MIRTSPLLLCLCLAPAASAQQPLSAIDWLDRHSTVPLAEPRLPDLNEPPVTDTATTPEVEVTALGEVRADAVGLLPTATTGLPRTIWSASSETALRSLLSKLEAHPLPAIQALYYTLLLAEADPPHDASADAAFLRARVHALVGYGAVEPARALLERAGPRNPALFDTWLSLTLLSGDEDQPCAMLRATPQLSADFGARVYCTARAGDWDTAALTYDTATALGALKGAEADLLAQYLDPELIETLAIPEAPALPSPLVFRLFEAAGAPLSTRRLPVAFALADLRGTAGWKTELEAAERLARTGALPASRFLGLFTERQPAASGGIWDRVSALQDFDRALFRQSVDDVRKTLPAAWDAAVSQGLQVPFAQIFSDKLQALELTGATKTLAFEIALLSSDYEVAATGHQPENARERLLVGIARGAPSAEDANTAREKAIVAGLTARGAAEDDLALLNEGKLGEAILRAAERVERGAGGASTALTDGLATLRAVGLQDAARRAALQLLLLDTGS